MADRFFLRHPRTSSRIGCGRRLSVFFPDPRLTAWCAVMAVVFLAPLVLNATPSRWSHAMPLEGLANPPVNRPAVTLSPTSLSFGNQEVSVASVAQTVTLTNTGTAVLTITSISTIGAASADYTQTNTCGGSVPAGANCTISVVFDPSVIGARPARVTITDNAAGGSQNVGLSGTGVAPAVTLSTPNLSFPGVIVGQSSSAETITVTNSGAASLTISSIVPSGDFSQTNTCSAAIAPGSSCAISVTFSPTASWSRGGSIVVNDNAYKSPQQVILLVGMGNSGAAAKLSPTSLNFKNTILGTVSAAQTVTVSNTGSVALNINSILTTGDYSQTNNCPSSLNAAATCTINVSFAPSNTGKRTGYITVNDTDPAFLQTVNISGTGVVASSAVNINPEQASLTPLQTQQFTVTINGVQSTNVTWSVDGIQGGNSTVGTISPSGLYTPPATAGAHVVQVTSSANSQQTAVAFVAATNYAGTFTMKNDTLRSGQNLNEVALTTGNVNSSQFGKLFSRSVDGQLYAQPLYVPNVTTSAGTYNVIYAATENDSVYAFDADGTATTPLWQTSLLTNGAQPLTSVDVNCTNITPQMGITSTPVIDPLTNTMFVLGRTKTGSPGSYSFYETLYALDITSGAVLQSVQIQASVTSGNNTVTFNPVNENQRAGLLLVNGVIYIAWASHCDNKPYSGWLMGYSETNLQQVSVFNATPNGSAGGIWQGGGGLAADVNGDVFAVTGNGTFDAAVGGIDYGDSVLKFIPSNGMVVADYFTPFNQLALTNEDWDLGGGAPILLPDQPGTYPHVILAGGKGSTLYEINRDSLGGFNSTANQILLTVPTILGSAEEGAGNRAAGPTYWQGQVYYAGSGANPMQFSLQNSLISTVPIVQSSKRFLYPGGSPAVSANASTNGIVWAVETDQFYVNGAAVLRAFDAANISRELYDSGQNATRDAAGPAVKFVVPTVANGKVYVGTQTELDVYGLLP